jgi:sugar phosphate isomerase/epimerase
MTAPIALQLYTLRDSLAQDFTAVVKKVAALGYVGVETAGAYGGSPQTAARLFNDLGLQVCSAHGPLPLGDKKQEVIDMLGALNCTRLVLAWQPPEMFQSEAGIKQVCESLNEAALVARAHGFTVGYHNHWFEYELLNQRVAADLMLEHLAPEVFLEVDVYWVQTGGQDPAAVVKRLGRRAPLLHIKDGPCVRGQPMTAVGEGQVDIAGVIQAGAGTTDWLIVELDACATDMFEAVQKSYQYLIGKGLARGNQN